MKKRNKFNDSYGKRFADLISPVQNNIPFNTYQLQYWRNDCHLSAWSARQHVLFCFLNISVVWLPGSECDRSCWRGWSERWSMFINWRWIIHKDDRGPPLRVGQLRRPSGELTFAVKTSLLSSSTLSHHTRVRILGFYRKGFGQNVRFTWPISESRIIWCVTG